MCCWALFRKMTDCVTVPLRHSAANVSVSMLLGSVWQQ